MVLNGTLISVADFYGRCYVIHFLMLSNHLLHLPGLMRGATLVLTTIFLKILTTSFLLSQMDCLVINLGCKWAVRHLVSASLLLHYLTLSRVFHLQICG